jgi:hypothetical protein
MRIFFKTVVHEEIREKIKNNFPSIWSILNIKAQNYLPDGILEFFFIPSGFEAFKIPERHTKELIDFCGIQKVSRAYRRDVSGAEDVSCFLDYLHEIILCNFLSRLSTSIDFKPKTAHGTASDSAFQVGPYTIYGEIKHLIDRWFMDQSPKRPHTRSLMKTAPGSNPLSCSKPRYMALQSKLEPVPRQFPDGTCNILFVFHSGFGEDEKYLSQALMGEQNIFQMVGREILYPDGLFALQGWTKISACYFARWPIDSAQQFLGP